MQARECVIYKPSNDSLFPERVNVSERSFLATP